MSAESSIQKYKLIAQVETSNSEEQTENDVNSAIKEASDILKSVHKSEKKELLKKFKEEYEELKESIKNSLDWDRNITKEELTNIKLELSDITRLAENNNIIETTSTISKMTNFFTWANNEEIKDKAQEIFEKDIDNYSTEEAKWALMYLNQKYSKYEEADLIDKITAINNDSIEKLDDKYEVRSFQEKLINIIFWNENWFKNWYNNEYLAWFSEEEKKWNYLVKISDFESQVNWQKAKDINSKALANYFKHLESNWLLTKEKLLDIFWEKTLKLLWNIWKGNPDDENSQIAKKILIENWLENIIEEVITFANIIENPEIFIPKFTNETLPKNTNELKKIWLEKLNKFNKNFTKRCPGFSWENHDNDMIKFKLFLSQTKQAEIEMNWEKRFNELFYSIIENKLTNSNKSEKEKVEIRKNLKIKWTELYNAWLELLKNPDESCWFVLADEIRKWANDFLTRYNLEKLKEEERIKLSSKVATTYVWWKMAQAKENEEEIKILENKEWDLSKDEEIILELRKKGKVELEKELKKGKRTLITSQATDEEIKEFKKIIENWWTKEEAYNSFKEKRDLIKKQNITQEINTNITSYNLSEKDYTLTPWGEYTITTPEWEDLIITNDEKEMTQNNPQALKNLINFHEIFKNLNMKSVWEYRHELIKWLWDVTINLDENAITESELIKIWNKLLDFINNSQNKEWKWEKSSENTLWGLKNKLIKFSWASSDLNDEKIVNSYWDDPFKALLRNTWVIWKWYFKYNKFKNTINWTNKNGK